MDAPKWLEIEATDLFKFVSLAKKPFLGSVVFPKIEIQSKSNTSDILGLDSFEHLNIGLYTNPYLREAIDYSSINLDQNGIEYQSVNIVHHGFESKLLESKPLIFDRPSLFAVIRGENIGLLGKFGRQ